MEVFEWFKTHVIDKKPDPSIDHRELDLRILSFDDFFSGIPGLNKINGIVVALPIDMSSSKILCIFTCICESEEKTRMTGHAKENNLHKNHLTKLLNRAVEETKVESKEKVQDYPSKGRGSL
ncbi:hypothetical protein NC653_004941 [Populus alba x Populus x berolinensis]|uniref:Uncharacterized protein n=1 Tax=Populus alba x Populus x berolinensis TaxID=444605 RepID=A0AAD6RAU3_9ROSI|nr:hypothetical protein NC653_004941 [Populus alba x Populus x berolinensis]